VAYHFSKGGVHAHVLDFPGAINCGSDLAEARRLLSSALLDMAALALERGKPLPRPDPLLSDPDADIEEPIHQALRGVTSAARCQTWLLVSRSAVTLMDLTLLTKNQV
jgi:predicted RNase H-like HicB family nuclease